MWAAAVAAVSVAQAASKARQAYTGSILAIACHRLRLASAEVSDER